MHIIKNTNRLNVVTGQKAFFQLQGLTTSHKNACPTFSSQETCLETFSRATSIEGEMGGKRVIYVISMR